jgi:hypothetical protein
MRNMTVSFKILMKTNMMKKKPRIKFKIHKWKNQKMMMTQTVVLEVKIH